MREIKSSDITKTVARLCQETNLDLGKDVLDALKDAKVREESPLGAWVLEQIIDNAAISAKDQVPLCQDCGATVVMLELGQDAHVVGGDLYAAVQDGVKKGYTDGYLRKSMVNQPFSARVNTKDNSPAIIYTDIVPGDALKITIMAKGGGAENKSRLFMLTPSQGRAGVIDSVVKAVEEAGSDPCPPIIVGVGIGGTSERAMLLAKKALLRKVGENNKDAELAELEKELLRKINDTGIGPQGLGGRMTALAVNVETFAAHIASMPVGVNIQCHSARHKEAIL